MLATSNDSVGPMCVATAPHLPYEIWKLAETVKPMGADDSQCLPTAEQTHNLLDFVY